MIKVTSPHLSGGLQRHYICTGVTLVLLCCALTHGGRGDPVEAVPHVVGVRARAVLEQKLARLAPARQVLQVAQLVHARPATTHTCQ